MLFTKLSKQRLGNKIKNIACILLIATLFTACSQRPRNMSVGSVVGGTSGAAFGGLTGGMLGLLATGKGNGALAGVLIGALLGGSSGASFGQVVDSSLKKP